MAITETIHPATPGHAARVEYSLPGGIKFELEQLPDLDAEPDVYFKAALQTLDEAVTKSTAIHSDISLSDVGKRQKIEPLQAKTVQAVAGAYSNAREYEAHINDIEAKLLEVPSINPTHSAVAIEDREIRDWFRAQGSTARLSIISALADNPQSQRVAIALMRSPIALVEQEAKLARSAWEAMKRAEQPAIAAEIENGRKGVAWLDRGLAHIAGITRMHVRMADHELLQHILSAPYESQRRGFAVFGFSQAQAANMAGRIEAMKRAA